MRHATLQEQYTSCGNKDCLNDKHGPYFYLYIRYGSLLSSVYIGKKRRYPTLKLINGKWRKFN